MLVLHYNILGVSGGHPRLHVLHGLAQLSGQYFLNPILAPRPSMDRPRLAISSHWPFWLQLSLYNSWKPSATTCIITYLHDRKAEADGTPTNLYDEEKEEQFKKTFVIAVVSLAFPMQLIFFGLTIAFSLGQLIHFSHHINCIINYLQAKSSCSEALCCSIHQSSCTFVTIWK